MSLQEGKVPHTQHFPLTLCPLHTYTREHDINRHWADPKMHSPYSEGQPVHPYQAGAAHTHHVPHVMPPSVGYLQSVKISAYHTNVPYNIHVQHTCTCTTQPQWFTNQYKEKRMGRRRELRGMVICGGEG